ncbi:alpha-tocopherol transfer protein-like isoform X4 [Nilaparvata lugens]|uniref:alpha-tocopherol transfer protein-like isoform X3 n=1 Tax=Nilaparvata lugens TaxID=108931 RepID=UPI000B9845CA|nr:alpha-tocopherol transfer protein-like isoform X3 [Nilaparvata lugens]XP_039290726.1 alpha-tocopherol transfer protein-like isoform X4 [Nilaparvata lugens]
MPIIESYMKSDCANLANNSVADMKVEPITAEEEYMKNPDLKKEEIAELKKWMKTQPHLPQNVTDEQLILFHHSCYYDMDATKACIEVYYTTRTNTPEFFGNRDILRPELQHALKVLHYNCLPVKDPNGYQIIYHKLQQFEAGKYTFNDGVKVLSMAIDACLSVEGTVPGYIFLFDMKGVRLGHLTRLSISSLRKFFLYLQEGMPVRLKAIHVLNTHSLIDKILMLVRPFMKKELMKMIHFHTDLQPVYEALSTKCLQKEYGGELESIDELHEKFESWMKSLRPYFKDEEKFRNDEKKRITDKKGKHAYQEQDLSLQNLCID